MYGEVGHAVRSASNYQVDAATRISFQPGKATIPIIGAATRISFLPGKATIAVIGAVIEI